MFIRATIVPLATPDQMRGRVMAVENVFIGASNELGAFESGVAGAVLGVGPAVWVGGVLTLGVVGVWSFAFPTLRDIDRFEDVAADDDVPDPPARGVWLTLHGSSAGEASDIVELTLGGRMKKYVGRVQGLHQQGRRRSRSPSAW